LTVDSGELTVDEDSSPREQSETVYSDDDVKPDEATGELTTDAE
jgi:hypothetical protein